MSVTALTAWRRPSIIPGFGLTLGFTLTYLSLIVLIPISALILRTTTMSWEKFYLVLTNERVLAALKVSFGASLVAACINALFGLIVAWVLVRYRFPGRRIVDAIVDLPFALPTAVAGIALTAIFAPTGWLGQYFDAFGIKIAYTWIGIVIALTFIGLPFVVRTLQPVIEEIDRQVEEAAATLGAHRGQTMWQVILPTLLPALLTGFVLSFARAVGEYGSVVFIAGNIPYRTEIAPLLIVIRLEEFDYTGAAAIATIMLAISFTMFLAINVIQAWSRRRFGDV
ncbi:MAG: sulfate ABC transporter permease subunit CysT [Xanthobacteraceae bacterium]|nr:sulfate ABC transporter permease subunit CysT [Xanthobacteraceae bacterium]